MRIGPLAAFTFILAAGPALGQTPAGRVLTGADVTTALGYQPASPVQLGVAVASTLATAMAAAQAAQVGKASVADLVTEVARAQAAENAKADYAGQRRSIREWHPACDGVTDDSAALAAAATTLRGTGAALYIPGNCRLLMGGAAQVWLSGMSIVGDGVQENTRAGVQPYGAQGSTILMTDVTKSPFVVSSGWAMRGLVFNWPTQTEATAVANGGNPTTFPALIAGHGNDTAMSWAFEGNQVENAWDIMNFINTDAGTGHFHISHNQMFALHRYFSFSVLGGETWLTDNQFTPAAYISPILGTTTTRLRDYAQANADVLYVTGNGTASQVSSTSIDGQRLSGNVGFMLARILHVVGGNYNLSSWVNNTWDQVPTVIQVEAGGTTTDFTVTGGEWQCGRQFDGTFAAYCAVYSGGAPGSSLSMSGVQIPVAYGGVISFTVPGAGSLSISGGRMWRIANFAAGATATPYYGVIFNSALGRLTMSGVSLETVPANGSNGGQGVVLQAYATVALSGLNFDSWNQPIANSFSGTAGSNRCSIVGSVSSGTRANAANEAVGGVAAMLCAQAGNNWDIGTLSQVLTAPNPGVSAVMRTSGLNQGLDIGASGSGVTLLSIPRLRAQPGLCGAAGLASGDLCQSSAHVLGITP